MSTATAGKVLLIPKGEYDATTQYKVLDWVLYQGRPYVAKQTTTGNAPIYAPTPQNPDAYWQLMLDFPTEVDNVPTENSQNLVYSGGVYGATADKMKNDGTNAIAIKFAPGTKTSFMSAALSKDAGAGEDVTMTFSVSGSDMILAQNIAGILKAHIGDNIVYVDNDTEVKVTISSVSIDSGDASVEAVGTLVDDTTDAISTTKTMYFYAYNDGAAGDIAAGAGSAVKTSGAAIGILTASNGTNAIALGSKTVAEGDNAYAEGDSTVAKGTDAHAEGYNTFAYLQASHAEGYHTWARGTGAHAEGCDTEATGNYSHASGHGTQAMAANETSIGAYNARSSNTGHVSILNVGNGIDDSHRSNAFQVLEDGTVNHGTIEDSYKIEQTGGKWELTDYYGNKKYFSFVVEFVNNNVTLSTSQDTTVTFTDDAITTDSHIFPFTSVWGIIPKSIVTTTGQCVLTFDKVSSAQTITVSIQVS